MVCNALTLSNYLYIQKITSDSVVQKLDETSFFVSGLMKIDSQEISSGVLKTVLTEVD